MDLDASALTPDPAIETRARVLATVSHEFRTPLNGILGMSGLLLDTGLSGEQATYVRAIQSSAEAFLRLVEDILDLSRIEAGGFDLLEAPFDLGALAQGVVELLAPRAQGKGVSIACLVGRDVPALVRGDPDRVRQVLVNLAGNAVKFTQTGGVGVAVLREPDGRIRLTVSDTGPGIAAGEAERIFEDYVTAEAGTCLEPGTGLGLAITRRLVDRMGGRIELDSAVGLGSRFSVVLPLPAEAEAPPCEPRAVPGRVLILSGSPFDAAYLARTLRDAGGQAEVAATLDAAGALMAGTRFDVLIADHALPGGDIRAATREAARHGVGRTIVLLSPFERRELGSPLASGFDAYLVKPVRPASLFEQLARPLEVAAEPPPARRQARRVLLAEDNEINALLAMKTLERLGAVVEWAKDGREALARLEAARDGHGLAFDVALMDIHMPGLDGREVVRRVRTHEGSGPRTRIVALTASVVGDPGRLVGADAFDAVLLKPFRIEHLATLLGRDEAAAAVA